MSETAEDEARAIKNATNRLEIVKARGEIVKLAQRYILATKRSDEEDGAEAFRELAKAVETLTALEGPAECKYEFSEYCGANVCTDCGAHKGLARCYCGWSASGGDGRRELEEDGERIDPEE